jgi:hypothetical protein
MNHHNDNHTERALRRATPRGADPGLRQEVLAAVRRELAADRGSAWQRRLGLAVAASLLLAVALNIWVNKASEQRLARLYGPQPVPRKIADVVEAVVSVTDAETGRRVQEQLIENWRSRAARAPQNPFDYAQIMRELGLAGEDTRYETRHQESTQVDRDRRRGDPGDTSYRQRHLRLDHRFTA